MQQVMRSGAAASVVRTFLAVALLAAIAAPVRPALALHIDYVQNANRQPYSFVNATGEAGTANWPNNHNWNQEQQTFIDGVGDTIVSAPSNWASPDEPNYVWYPGSPNDPYPSEEHDVFLEAFTVNGNVDATVRSLNIGSGGILNTVSNTSLTILSELNISSGGILNMLRVSSLTMGGDNATVSELNISSGTILNMLGGNTSLTIVRGSINNDGTINLQDSGILSTEFADLKIADGTTLAGNGRVMLGGSASNRIYGVTTGNEELINSLTHTISGGGRLGNNFMKLTNQGLIDANLAAKVLYINPSASGVTNTGTIQASWGGIVRLQDGTFTNTDGEIQALDGSQVQLGEGSTVVGGTLSSSGSGKIVVTDNTFSGITFSILSGTITNNGLVSLESSGPFTDLKIADGTTLAGNGRVMLGGSASNRIYGVTTGNEELINSLTHTISGGGRLGNNFMKLTNQGLIDANLAAKVLYINPSASGVTNTGTIQASWGGIVRLQDGTFTNTDGEIQALDGSQVQLGEGSTVVGGTLSSSGSGKIVVTDNTFSGITFSILSGTITNNGLVSLESSGPFTDLKIADGTTLTGNGRVVLGGSASNRIYGVTTGNEELINSLTHTISGGGRLGNNFMKLTNQGLIDANLAGNALIVDPNAAGVVNQASGILRASGAAELQLTDGTFDNQGMVEALNGSSVTYSTSAITANNVAGVLTGGTWRSVATGGGATITLRGTNNITQIASGTEVVLSGVGSVLRRVTTSLESTLTANNGTLRVLDGRAFTMTNAFNNAGTVEVGGSGLADATLSTSTLTNSGTLLGQGMVVGNVLNSSGTVSPGSSPGTLHVTGNYSQSAAAKLQIELASTLSFDKLDVTGSMTLGGTLQVTLVSFQPNAGNSFDILDWGTLAGTFATIQLPSLAGGLIWNTTQMYTAGVLTVGGVLGDYNLNGVVDAADYTVWRNQLNSSGLALAADGNADGEVTPADYDVWSSHFGETAPSLPAAGASVPEPTAWVLMLSLLATSILWTNRVSKR